MNPTQKQFSLTGVSLNKANAYQYDLKLFNALRELRTQLAAKRGVPPFIILGDRALQEMSTYYPINLGDLLQINGFGEKKINDFGGMFLQLITRYCETFGIESKPFEKSAKKTKAKSVSTSIAKGMTTKEMVDQKKSLEQIAKAQSLRSTRSRVGEFESFQGSEAN